MRHRTPGWEHLGLRPRATLLATALLALPAVAHAQPTTPLDSGTVVRLHLVSGAVQRGRLITRLLPAAPTVTYCRYPGIPCRSPTDPGVRTIDLPQVTRLDAADGSHWLRGALVGGAIGAALGAIAIAFGEDMCETAQCSSDGRRGAAVVLVLGIGLGAAFGSASLSWQPVW